MTDILDIVNLTNGQILALCILIFLAVLIFPYLIRRKKIQRKILEKYKKHEDILPEDFDGKDKLPITHNSQKNEIEELVVSMKGYCFKHGMKIVFPGNIHCNNQTGVSTIIVTGSFGLLSVRCYGFGGHIYRDPRTHRYMQNMNGNIKEIIDPEKSMRDEKFFIRKFLNDTRFMNIPVYTSAVFTRSNVILSVPEHSHIYNRKNFKKWFETDPIFQKESKIDTYELTSLLVEAVKNH